MESNDLLRDVLSGRRPSSPDDFGPFTVQVQNVFKFLESNRLLRFLGRLDEQLFIAISVLDDAIKRAYNPDAEDFHWEEDGHLVWKGTPPPNVLKPPQIWEAYRANLKRIDALLDQFIDHTMPESFRYYCYDSVLADFIEITKGFAMVGKQDEFYGRVWEAYQQGGWPCGLTGGRPAESDLCLEGRRMYVFWPK